MIRATDTYTWQEIWSDYSTDDGWSLKWRLVAPTAAAKEKTAVSVGTQHTFTLLSADTNVASGTYTQIILAQKGSGANAEQKTLSVEAIQVLPSPTAANIEKGYWRTTYELLLATYQKSSAESTSEMSAHQRHITLRSLEELRRELAYAKAQMIMEEEKSSGGIAFGRFISV